jgi:hypothetical protein
MDNLIHQQVSNTQLSGKTYASAQIFDRILNWLAGFILLTEQEQKDAGIDLDRQHNDLTPGQEI